MSQRSSPNGVIFFSNNMTAGECLQRALFGAPGGSKNQDLLKSIEPHATRLFLFNSTSKEFVGPFRAQERYGFNLEPTAWASAARVASTVSPFPLQIRVYPEERVGPKKLGEGQIRKFLTYVGNGKFSFSLSNSQAEGLGDELIYRGTRAV